MNKFKKIITTATLAVVAFLGPVLTMAPAHADAGLDNYANSQRAAAGVGALKSNAAMTAEAQAAADRYAASGSKADVGQPHTTIPGGASSSAYVGAEGANIQAAYGAGLSKPTDAERMNRATWTDIGSGLASARGKTYIVIVYAAYPAPIAAAPAPAPAPAVQAPAIPAPVQAAPAPVVEAPAPVIEEPVAEAPAAPVVEAPAAAPVAVPKPSESPSATATPSTSAAASELPTAAPLVEEKIEQAAMASGLSWETAKPIVFKALIGALVLVLIAIAFQAWKVVRLKAKLA